MSNKITIIKVLPKGDEFLPSPEDFERWQQKIYDAEVTLEEAAATGEVEVQTLPERTDGEHYLTLVKVGYEDFAPTVEELESWRNIFEEAAKDPDFKIFTYPGVEVEVINIGKIVSVE